MKAWEEQGVAYIQNSRTNQQMPHYFQFYTTFKENEDRLTIRNAVSDMNNPVLIVHGSEDETVDLKEARALQEWSPKSVLRAIEGANHTFGSVQPWLENKLPPHLDEVVRESLDFVSG